MDALGILNQVRQSFDVSEAYLVTEFEIAKDDVELRVTVRDGGVLAGSSRYVVTVSRGGSALAEAGPEATVDDALRNAYSKAKSLL